MSFHEFIKHLRILWISGSLTLQLLCHLIILLNQMALYFYRGIIHMAGEFWDPINHLSVKFSITCHPPQGKRIMSVLQDMIYFGRVVKLWYIYRIIYGLAWITIFVTSGVIGQWFFTSDEFTSENHCRIISRITKTVIHTNTFINLFLTGYIMPWMHKSIKNNQWSLISPLSQGRSFFWLSIVTSSQLVCNITRTQGTVIVTSNLSIVLARTDWRNSELHLRN